MIKGKMHARVMGWCDSVCGEISVVSAHPGQRLRTPRTQPAEGSRTQTLHHSKSEWWCYFPCAGVKDLHEGSQYAQYHSIQANMHRHLICERDAGQKVQQQIAFASSMTVCLPWRDPAFRLCPMQASQPFKGHAGLGTYVDGLDVTAKERVVRQKPSHTDGADAHGEVCDVRKRHIQMCLLRHCACFGIHPTCHGSLS